MANKLLHDPFPSNQKVLVIDSDQTELTLINENLVPPIQKITTVTELGEEITRRIKEKGDFLTLIIGSKLPSAIKEKFSSLTLSLNSLNETREPEYLYKSVSIIRIGKADEEKEEVFKNTIAQYNTVTDFIDDIDSLSAKGITKDLNVSDDIKRKINRLETSNTRYKEKIKTLQSERDNLTEQLSIAKEKIDGVQIQQEIAQQKLDKANQLTNKVEKEKQQTKEKIEALTRQTENDSATIKDLNLSIAEKDTKLDALEQEKTELNAEINTLNQKKNDLEDKIQTLEIENDDLSEQQSEIQKTANLRKNLKIINSEKDDLKEEINKLKRDNIVLESQKESLEKRLDKFREGEKDIIATGVSKHLPVIPLKRTNVIYFKVLQEPNYFRTVLNFLYDKIFVQSLGKEVVSQMVVLRQDNGELDNLIFPKMTMIKDLGELIEPNNKSRLIATQKMSRHTDVFENNNDFLFFIDYINSKDFYIETEAKMQKIVVSHTYKEFKKSGLSGLPITMQKEHSLFDLSYQKDFKNLTKQLYEKEMIDRLDKFLSLPLVNETMKLNL